MNNWDIRYKNWKSKEQALRESLCALGNGFIVTRASAEEVGDNSYNYPGTYLAGGYNRLTTKIAEKEIENEALVNWPNWLYQTFKHLEKGEWLDLEKVEVLDYEQQLDLKQGLLIRKFRFRDNKKIKTKQKNIKENGFIGTDLYIQCDKLQPIKIEKIVSMAKWKQRKRRNTGITRQS